MGNYFTYSDVNYNDYNAAQKWSSIAVKTGLDVGVGLGATALAVAILSVTPIGASAIAVGAVGAGITWLANEATQAITSAGCGEEYGLTEAVTNVIVSAGTEICGWISTFFE